jgi:ketosteroid isomerase-like protein
LDRKAEAVFRDTAYVSQENVEIVRRVYEAVAKRDAAAVLALYDAEGEWDASRLPEARIEGGSGLWQGHEGIRGLNRQWSEAWTASEDHCDELIDAGEHVISVVTRKGRGRASGVEVETRRAGVWTVRAGKVVRTVWFPSVEEALYFVGSER